MWNRWRDKTRHDRLCQHNLQKLKRKRQLRLFRNVVDAWREDAHAGYKQRFISLKPEYYNQRKAEVIDEWDNLIEGLKGYIAQLQMEIKVEVSAKTELVKLYEAIMNGSVKKFNIENEFITQVHEANRSIGNDTFGRDLGKETAYRPVDIGRLTLLKEQEDPEDEEESKHN